VRPITHRRRYGEGITRAPDTRRPARFDHVIAKRPARDPVVRLPTYPITFVYGSSSSNTK